MCNDHYITDDKVNMYLDQQQLDEGYPDGYEYPEGYKYPEEQPTDYVHAAEEAGQ